MKNLLYTLLFVSILGFAQEQDPCYSVNDIFIQIYNENPTITKDFLEGWNMFGYPCSQSSDLDDAFSSIVENVIIVKDNNGFVYIPEYGFRSIAFLVGGEGYQIKMHNNEFGFSFCQPITLPNLEGCTDCEALNFNQWANTDDGSCDFPCEEGFIADCNGNCASENWLGDGYCDEGVYVVGGFGIYFNCDQFNNDNGDCNVRGCLDETACNFNSVANIDDGLCTYDGDNNGNCDNNFIEHLSEGFYIPDGTGVTYSSNIDIIAYNPTTILDEENVFTQVCAEIEHSYLGDLDMSLTSPNGTTVSLFTQVGGSTWLGNALDNDATQTPGECWNYCWSIEPEFGTFANSLDNTMQAPLGGNSMIPGSYEPLGNFSDFEGSNANGVWTLNITDHLSVDNGFVCSWGLSINTIHEVIMGCSDQTAYNYNPSANTDDGTCEYIGCPYSDFLEYNPDFTIADVSMCLTLSIPGCTNSIAQNYNSQASQDDGSCIIYGCINLEAVNYNPQATTQDDSCVFFGCTNNTAVNYNEQASLDDGSCIIYGCTLSAYTNYNPEATIDDLSCSFNGDVIYGCTNVEALNYYPQANSENGSCEFSNEIENFNGHTITLPSGWNLIGYSCDESSGDLIQLLAPILDIIIIVKDNTGNAYLPEYNYNGIGDFYGGLGYQLKTTEIFYNFNICD